MPRTSYMFTIRPSLIFIIMGECVVYTLLCVNVIVNSQYLQPPAYIFDWWWSLGLSTIRLVVAVALGMVLALRCLRTNVKFECLPLNSVCPQRPDSHSIYLAALL